MGSLAPRLFYFLIAEARNFRPIGFQGEPTVGSLSRHLQAVLGAAPEGE